MISNVTFDKTEYAELPHKFEAGTPPYVEAIGLGAAVDYLENLGNFNFKEDYLVDKAPLNFRWIGFIRILFPNSKIIHCTRDPMDTCFSNFKNSFAGPSHRSSSLMVLAGHQLNPGDVPCCGWHRSW